jgi:hypothetical protein
MKLGNKANFFFFLFFLLTGFAFAEDKISSTPLLNLEKIKPSFEELSDENNNLTTGRNIKEKTK